MALTPKAMTLRPMTSSAMARAEPQELKAATLFELGDAGGDLGVTRCSSDSGGDAVVCHEAPAVGVREGRPRHREGANRCSSPICEGVAYHEGMGAAGPLYEGGTLYIAPDGRVIPPLAEMHAAPIVPHQGMGAAAPFYMAPGGHATPPLFGMHRAVAGPQMAHQGMGAAAPVYMAPHGHATPPLFGMHGVVPGAPQGAHAAAPHNEVCTLNLSANSRPIPPLFGKQGAPLVALEAARGASPSNEGGTLFVRPTSAAALAPAFGRHRAGVGAPQASAEQEAPEAPEIHASSRAALPKAQVKQASGGYTLEDGSSTLAKMQAAASTDPFCPVIGGDVAAGLHRRFPSSSTEPSEPLASTSGASSLGLGSDGAATRAVTCGSASETGPIGAVLGEPLRLWRSWNAHSVRLESLGLEEVGALRLFTWTRGNCQFVSVSYLLWGTPDRHQEVRQAAVVQMLRHPERYSSFVPDDFETFALSMAAPGTWGDIVTLTAISDSFCVNIKVVSSTSEGEILSFTPKNSRGKRTLWLSFFEMHYKPLEKVAKPRAGEEVHEDAGQCIIA